MKEKKIIKLPRFASSTEEGPLIKHDRVKSVITIDYDSYDNDKWEWVRIVFKGIFYFAYHSSAACDHAHIIDFDTIECFDNTKLLKTIRKRWRERYLVMFPDSEGGENELLHYRIFFDHYGAIDVIALRFEIVGIIPQEEAGK
jgi:hypothetical protein